jgi:two-component system, OmpR family, alkaline phosphatase synthesis response regulator PhoP
VDESVCHLQDSFVQVSLGREGPVPVWVGMGSLATKSGEVPAPRVALADRILVIVDDHDSRQALQTLLSLERYEVEVVTDGLTALEKLRRRPPSALILDLRGPGSSGYDLCREIAQSAPWLPFVILGVSSDVLDKIVLLEIGADDYLAKPFVPRELAARLRALMRRVTRASRESPYVFDDVTVDFSTMDVTRRGEKVLLTAQEFKTLEFMIKNKLRVISRDQFLNEVWGYQSYPKTRTVDNHILKLRQKLESNPSNPSHFLTIHGIGYKFVP